MEKLLKVDEDERYLAKVSTADAQRLEGLSPTTGRGLNDTTSCARILS